MVAVKIQCACGQRYSFELEPGVRCITSGIVCPICGADGTDAANAVLSREAQAPSGVRLSIAARPDALSNNSAEPSSNTPTRRADLRRPPAAIEFNNEHRRGRLIFVCAFTPLLACYVLIVASVLALHVGNPIKEITRALLNTAFAVGTYLGLPWTKRLLLISAILSIIDSGGDLLTKPNWFSAFDLLIALPIPAVLLLSKSVNAFLDYQDRER